jgi:hypothetical protein
MTAAVAQLATDQDHRLVDGYARYCQNLTRSMSVRNHTKDVKHLPGRPKTDKLDAV